jgi:hypothetical protein
MNSLAKNNPALGISKSGDIHVAGQVAAGMQISRNSPMGQSPSGRASGSGAESQIHMNARHTEKGGSKAISR